MGVEKFHNDVESDLYSFSDMQVGHSLLSTIASNATGYYATQRLTDKHTECTLRSCLKTPNVLK